MNASFYPEIDRFFEDLAKDRATFQSTEKLLDYYNKKTQETESLLNRFRIGSGTKESFHLRSSPQKVD
jgi:hypothetical protein